MARGKRVRVSVRAASSSSYGRPSKMASSLRSHWSAEHGDRGGVGPAPRGHRGRHHRTPPPFPASPSPLSEPRTYGRRCDARRVGPVHQLVRAAAPHVDGPDGPGLVRRHQLRAQVEGLGVLPCDLPAPLVRPLEPAGRAGAREGQALGEAAVRLHLQLHGALLHLPPRHPLRARAGHTPGQRRTTWHAAPSPAQPRGLTWLWVKSSREAPSSRDSCPDRDALGAETALGVRGGRGPAVSAPSRKVACERSGDRVSDDEREANRTPRPRAPPPHLHGRRRPPPLACGRAAP